MVNTSKGFLRKQRNFSSFFSRLNWFFYLNQAHSSYAIKNGKKNPPQIMRHETEGKKILMLICCCEIHVCIVRCDIVLLDRL